MNIKVVNYTVKRGTLRIEENSSWFDTTPNPGFLKSLPEYHPFTNLM